MSSLPSPELILALAKITALLLVILALSPLFKSPVHRANLWTLTFLVLPLIFLSSFTTSLLQIIPKKLSSSPKETLTVNPEVSSLANPPLIEPLSISESLTLPPETILPSHSIDPIPQTALASPNSTISHTPHSSNPFPWLPIAIAIGTLISLLPFLISSVKVLRLPQTQALNPPAAVWKRIHECSANTPPLSFTPSPAAPFTCGIINPRVLLPDDSPSWPLRRINSTLLHEAAHLRRRDPLVRLLAAFVRASLWFHPLIWIAHRQLVAAQEQACDQYALNHGITPADYAEDLLASATHSHLTPTDALSMAKSSQLGNRIRKILEKPKANNITTIALTSFLALITTLAITSIGFSKKPAPTQREKTEINPNKTRGDILDRNNIPLATDDQSGKRTYPLAESVGHLTGYLRKANAKKPKQTRGISGLEKTFETALAQKDDIKLTIDSDIQSFCYQLLSNQEFPGAIVIQDPNTGEILALTSYPSFDPNLFIPVITRENFNILTSNKLNPLMNRATSPFTPGGIVKPLIAIAGEYAGLQNPEIHCKGFMTFGANRKMKISDWKRNRDEKLRIPGALQTSCNTYFMELGIRAGKDSLKEVGDLFHLNESPLASATSHKGIWMTLYKGFTNHTRASLALSSLGQGNALISPLHVNTITCAIASGILHEPHLILGQESLKPPVTLIGKGEITADSLTAIRTGLHLAIHEKRGTATLAAIPSIQLAGKTATAQVSKNSTPSNHSWFTGYGPYEKPKYSVTVMLNGAKSGGKFAAPIAKEIFQKLLVSQ